MANFDKIILHIPHSSVEFIDKNKWSGDINNALNKWTDWHTDKLFYSDNPNVIAMIFPYSRLECDVERLLNDELNSIGQGIVYRSIEGCTRQLSDLEIYHIYNLYMRFNEKFGDEVLRCSNPLIIDCHSFPSEVSPNIDICIGYNEDNSKPTDEVLNLVKEHFEKKGYRVAFNAPYSNSKCIGSTSSLMIEVNKSLYLQSNGIDCNSDMYKLNFTIKELYNKLLKI